MKPINQACLALAVIAVALRFHPGQLGGGPQSKHVVIVEESSERTPKQAMAFVAIQNGDEAKRRAAKGVTLEIVDRDDADEHGTKTINPDDYKGMTLPAIVFYSKRSGKVLYREALGKECTADSITAICKRHGA